MDSDDSDSSCTISNDTPVNKPSRSMTSPSRPALHQTTQRQPDGANFESISVTDPEVPNEDSSTDEDNHSILASITDLLEPINDSDHRRPPDSAEAFAERNGSRSPSINPEQPQPTVEEFCNDDHLKDLQWAEGCINTCDFNILDGTCSSSSRPHDPFHRDEQAARNAIQRTCDALRVGISALILVAGLGEVAQEGGRDGEHLGTACIENPGEVVRVMEGALEEMGELLRGGSVGSREEVGVGDKDWASSSS
jgi:hypothetical protein